MKLHSDVLTVSHVNNAKNIARDVMGGVLYLDVMRVGSRARERAFEVRLTGDGSQTARKQNTGYSGASQEYSAGYASWGWLMAELYEADPDAIWGSPGRPTYADREDFHHATGHRFDTSLSVEDRRELGSNKWTPRV